MGMNILSCKTPDMALKEVRVYLLAYNLIRLLMAQSAFTADIMPRDISFKHCLQLWLLWSQQADTSDDEQLYGLYMLIAQQRVGKRPGRIEPRAVKRRPKAHPLLTVPRPEAQENIRKKWPLEEAKVSAILVRPQFLRRTGLSQMPRPTKCFGCVGL